MKSIPTSTVPDTIPMANATATTSASHNRRCGGCRCVAYLIIFPIVMAMLMEFLFGVWFMHQRQGLWPLTDVTHNNMNVGTIPYTRTGRFEILERVPHDTNAFTQGLVMIQDATPPNDETTVRQHLYEGTGMYGASQLRRVDIQTGKVLAFHSLEKAYFGEGIAHYRDDDHRLHIIQLTWKKQRAFEYIFDTDNVPQLQQQLQQQRRDQLLVADGYKASWKYQTTTNEGWGITYSPSQHVWYVSDGSEYIHVWNVDTKEEIRKFAVTYQHASGNHEKIDHTRTAIQMINELEYDPVTDTILANVWRENIIIRIDPQTGFVTTMYDLNDLLPNRDRTWQTDVLNGIALTYDATVQNKVAITTKHLNEIWVTGKYWPYMFRIRLIDSVGIEIDNRDKTCSI